MIKQTIVAIAICLSALLSNAAFSEEVPEEASNYFTCFYLNVTAMVRPDDGEDELKKYVKPAQKACKKQYKAYDRYLTKKITKHFGWSRLNPAVNRHFKKHMHEMLMEVITKRITE